MVVPAPVIQFGDFAVDLHTGELHKSGARIKLQEKPFRILAILLDRPGELITREELRQKLWSADTFVDFDHSLGTAIGKLRQALGDSPQNPKFVETVSSRGYRFVGAIHPRSQSLPRPLQTIAALEEAHKSGERANSARGLRNHVTAIIALVLLLALILGISVVQRRFLRSSDPVIGSVAVLPLENLSGDTGQEFLADGMTDALITNLAKIGALHVVSRTSIMRYKGTSKSARQIAGELNVDSIVEGSIEREGKRVRISAKLISAATDRHLWAESYDREVSDLLRVQEEIAQSIAREIQVKLTTEEKKGPFSRMRAPSIRRPTSYT